MTKLELISLLLALNFILKLKSYKAPLNYDTSSHMYFAFLKNKKINFLSSYLPGIKFLLPRTYVLLLKIVKDKYYHFRAINIFFSSLLIIFLVLTDRNIGPEETPIYLTFVLSINSLWVEYHASAAEFHGEAIMFLALAAILSLPFYASLPIFAFLTVLAFWGYKAIYALYAAPFALFYEPQIVRGNWLLFALTFLTISIFAVALYKSLKNIKRYSKTRKILSFKNLKFTFYNTPFVVFIWLLAFGNLYYAPDFRYVVLQLVLIAIFLLQRNYIGYFYYPLIVFSFFICFQIDLPSRFPAVYGWTLFGLVFVFHTLRHILIRSARDIDIIFREKTIRYRDYGKQLNLLEETVAYIKENLSRDSKVYLWGSNVALLLLPGLTHVEGVYYNHNHLIYWSDISDPKAYAENVVIEKKPDYVIESGVIKEIFFPEEKFKSDYKLIFAKENIKIYEKQKA